jgi:hypothetical protein
VQAGGRLGQQHGESPCLSGLGRAPPLRAEPFDEQLRRCRGRAVGPVQRVDAGIGPIVLIPQNLAGGFHGLSIELPNEKACYQL